MPLSLNIGRSIKTSHNYNSSGYSINLTAELDNALLSRPQELQDAINQLYQQADLALERQMNSSHPRNSSLGNSSHQPRNSPQHSPQRNSRFPNPNPDPSRPASPRSPASHSAGSNSSSSPTSQSSNTPSPSSNSRPHGSSTQSQRRAIEAICHDLNLPLQTVFADLDIQHFDQLNIRQASQLIDQLKAHQNTPGTHISGNQDPHPRNSSNPTNHHSRPYPESPTANTTWSHR